VPLVISKLNGTSTPGLISKIPRHLPFATKAVVNFCEGEDFF